VAHPIVGLWKVTVTLGDKEFKTAQNWEATGERSMRMVTARPMVTGTLMDREFHGWQDVSGEATVDEDDILVAEAKFDIVDEQGRPQKGTVSTRGERVTLK